MNELRHCRRRFLGLLGTGLLATGTGISAAERGTSRARVRSRSDADWPTENGTVGHTGYNDAASPPTDGVALDWVNHFADAATRPIVAEGWIGIWDATDSLYDIDLETGAIDDRTDSGYGQTFPLTVVDGVAYLTAHGYLTGGHVLAAPLDEDEDLLWQRELDVEPAIRSSAIVVDGVVCFGTQDGLRALDADDGADRWTFETAGGTDVPAAADGTIYTAYTARFDDDDESGTVYAVDAASGDEQWTWTGEDSFIGPLAVADGRVYVRIGGGFSAETVVALDAATGNELWRTDFESGIEQPVAVGDGTVYVTIAGFDDSVIALDAATGEERWRQSLWNSAAGQPVVADETVYVATERDETLYAFDAADGAKRWEATLPVGDSPTLALAGDRLIVAGDTLVALKPGRETSLEHRADGLPIDWRYDDAGDYGAEPLEIADGTAVLSNKDRLYSFDPTDGETEWETTIDTGENAFDSVLRPLGATADGITVATEEGIVAALDWTDGEVTWRTTLEEGLVAGPTVGSDGVYVETDADELVALDDGGAERWRFEPDDRVASIAGVADDTVVVGTTDGQNSALHALATSDGEERWHLETSSRGGPDAIIAGGMVVASDGTDVIALPVDDGTEQWSVEFERGMRTATAADGMVYVVTAGGVATETTGSVSAIEAATGEKQWSRRIGEVELPPVVIGGTVYVATQRGTTYALEGATGELLGWRHFQGEISALAAHDETVFVTFGNSSNPVALDASGTVTPPLGRQWPSWAGTNAPSTSETGTGTENSDSETDPAESDDGSTDGSDATDDSSPGFGVFGTAAGVAGAGAYRLLASESESETESESPSAPDNGH